MNEYDKLTDQELDDMLDGKDGQEAPPAIFVKKNRPLFREAARMRLKLEDAGVESKKICVAFCTKYILATNDQNFYREQADILLAKAISV